MPFPDAEVLRAAVESAIHDGLDVSDGTWIAELPDGREAEFSPAGEFEVRECLDDDELDALPDDQPAEKVYVFRVRVELVEVRDGE